MSKIAALVVLGLLPLAGCAHRYSEPYAGYQPGPYSYYDIDSDRGYDRYGPPSPYYDETDTPPAYGPGYGPAYSGSAYSDRPYYGPGYGPGYGATTNQSRYSSSYYSAPAPYPPPPYNSSYYSTYYGCGCAR
jgi:hypothetical protein